MRRLPGVTPTDRVGIARGDVVIHAPGFEDRTMAIVDLVAPVGRPYAILIEYFPIDEKNRFDDVRNGLLRVGMRVPRTNIVRYDRFDPRDYESRIAKLLVKRSARRVVLDLSSMSKLLILLTLNVCAALDLQVTVVYAEANEYCPTQADFEAAKARRDIHRPTIQIFTGVHGVVRVNSLASVAMQGQPTAALVFMSFNDVLTQVLLNTVCPSRLYLINGKPPIHSWREEATAWIHDQVRREWQEDNPVDASAAGTPRPQRAVSTLDYRETLSLLLTLYWQLSPTHRVLLAPAGSKMQAIGCYLIKALHPDIQIEYPSPTGFRWDYYSSGIGDRWLLPLGRLSTLLDRIYRAERRRFLQLPTLA